MQLEGEREMLTVAEAADALGLTVRGVQERLRRGTLRGIHPSPRIWLIPRDEVERWRNKGKLKPGRPRKQQTEP